MTEKPPHSACIPLNPVPVQEYMDGKSSKGTLTLPALQRILELVQEAFPRTRDWSVGRTLAENRSVFFGHLSPTICLSLSFPEGDPRCGRALLFRIKKGQGMSRSRKPVDPFLDDPIDGYKTSDLVGWFSFARVVFEEESRRKN